MELPVDFSLCKEVYEKFGEGRLFSRGENFARSGEIALEDSEVIVIPAKIMREKLNGDRELNMNMMMGLFEQLYDQFVEFN
ncbi:MAG: hypothetical protein K2J58_01665 [Muribaculaceae bacterium]|nr:hypothetical protein [Muribaculaceae bacterium]